MRKFIPFSLPEIDDDDINAVCECLRSGWITTGPKTEQFEKEFAAYLGGDFHTIAVNSATAGLHLALEALGIGPGDEVIIPSPHWVSYSALVELTGATPVIVPTTEASGFVLQPEH